MIVGHDSTPTNEQGQAGTPDHSPELDPPGGRIETDKASSDPDRPQKKIPDLPGDRGEVLTVPEVAKLLRLGRNAVYDACSGGKIPHWRIGKQIRFSRRQIMRLLSGVVDQ